MMVFNDGLFRLPFLILCLLLPLTLQTLRRDSLLTPSTFDRKSLGCELNIELKTASCRYSGLNSVPQNLSNDILRFDLFGNNITSLLSWSFKRYPLITSLDLSQNDIRVIERTALHPLKDLMHLDISFNPHLVLPATGLLRWARKLSTLNLQSSNLQSLPNDILKWSPRLESARLHGNHLKVVHVRSCGTSEYVNLSKNQIRHINAEAFDLMCDVGYLDLQGNPIRSVVPDVVASLHVRSLLIGNHRMTFKFFRDLFSGISHSEIKEIKISDPSINGFPKKFFDPLRDWPIHMLEFSYMRNGVHVLYPFVFSNLTRVHELSFGNNYINRIEPDYFEGMLDLRVLRVTYCQLKDINTDNHTWTVDLVELHLAGNYLTEITPQTFLGLRNLTFLDLYFNERLATFKLNSLSGLDKLQVINISKCAVFRWRLDVPALKWLSIKNNLQYSLKNPLVPGESFKETISLVSLDLINSILRVSNLWDATVNISIFDRLFNLTTLDLSGNSFLRKGLPPFIFRQLSALQELSIEFCYISNLYHLTFLGLVSLQKLSLRGNKIHQLHQDLFQGLVQVRSMNLQGNLLSYLDETIFSNNTKLTTLSLADNKLTSLNKSTFQSIKPSLSSIDLSINPINCNCDLKWLLDWLSGPVHMVNKDETICSLASLDAVKEKPLLDFDPNELCGLNIVLYTVLSLAVICFVFVVGCVYHNRWQLRFKLYLLKLAALGYKEIRDARDHNDYEFDLNIIFYDDDEHWIREQLEPAFEERLQQFERNVLGDGDLVLGMHYLDSVDNVVTRSYKTVIVLSRAAVRDRMFMLKFRIAMDHVSDTQTEFVVVVFLEDIPEGEIPFLARLYLSDCRPYLHWPNDERGQEYFWNELVKSLTINLRTNDLIPNE